MTLSVPRNSRAMYCTVGFVLLLIPGCGPIGLATGMTPLPLATNRLFPSGVTRTDVGYHPTGMKPSDRLLPGTLTSKTATILLFAFAMKSIVSSGDRATLFGVEPGGDCGNNAAQIVSIARPASVSSTVTVLRLALATNRSFPERVSAISHGCSSVAHRATTWLDFKSITATAACPQRLT